MVVGADAGTHVLVAKSRGDIEKMWPAALRALGRGALSLLGRGGTKAAAAGKGAQVGVKGAAGTAGATGAGAITPAAGATTTALQPASATAGTSMASNSSAQGATQAAPVKVQPSQLADPIGDAGGESAAPWMRGGAGFDAAQQEAATSGGVKVRRDPNFDKLAESSKEPTAATSELDDVPITDADPVTIDDVEGVAEQAAKDKSTYNVPKPFQRVFGETIDRDKAQNYGAAGIVGISHMRQRGAQKNAEMTAEQDRISRLAEETRAKAGTGTGGKVAVA